MKKVIVLMMALSLVAFALPALAQDLKVGSGNANNNMVGGDITDDSVNKGANNSHYASGATVHVGDEVNVNSGNTPTITDTWKTTVKWEDTSTTTTTYTDTTKTTFDFKDTSLTDTTITGSNNTAFIGLNATDSMNDNLIYWGDQESAHENEYQFAHESDHQVMFEDAFSDSRNVTPYMPISNVHLSQANTGLNTGDGAGAVGGGLGSGAALNYSYSTVAGVLGSSTNLGGVAQNQAAVNVVTAFAP